MQTHTHTHTKHKGFSCSFFSSLSADSLDESTDAALRWMFISSHHLVLIQPVWDIWGPHSPSMLSSALVLRYISATLMTPGSLSAHQKGDPLSFCFKTCLKQLSSGPARGGFSHVHPIIRVLSRSCFLPNLMGGRKSPDCWMDMIQKPALPHNAFVLFDFSPIVNGFCCPPPNQYEEVVGLVTLSL